MKRTASFFLAVALLSGLIACEQLPGEPEFNNPFMPGDISYTAPMINIMSGPQNNEVVTVPTVTFEYDGNTGVTDFSYRLDEDDWSGWTGEKTVTFSFLDEGQHTFWIRGRNMMGVQDSMNLSRPFEIDAIRGPALWFSSRHRVVQSGTEFTVTLMAEEMYNLMGVYAPVMYDPDAVTLVSYNVLATDGAYLMKNGGSVIQLVDQEASLGLVGLNLAVVEASPPGLDGSGRLATLTFRANSPQQTTIRLGTETRVTDSDLVTNYLSRDDLFPAQVEVQ